MTSRLTSLKGFGSSLETLSAWLRYATRHGIADAFWPVEATRASPGQRATAQAAVDAVARAALRASGEVIPAPAPRGRHTPRGVRHAAGHRAGPGGVWLDDQHGRHRALNLDIRQRVAAVGRRVNTLCRGEESLRDQLVLFQMYHNFVVSHASLRQPLPVAKATNGGSAKVWRPCTSAMAAGLTDHMWSLKEVLCYRVPPWPQAQTV